MQTLLGKSQRNHTGPGFFLRPRPHPNFWGLRGKWVQCGSREVPKIKRKPLDLGVKPVSYFIFAWEGMEKVKIRIRRKGMRGTLIPIQGKAQCKKYGPNGGKIFGQL